MTEKALQKMEETKTVVKFTADELQLIKDTVAKDATDAELKLFLYVAQLRGLNPLTRQIHFVKRGGKGVIQTGIDAFRLIAERTRTYAPGGKPTLFEYDPSGRLTRATVFGIKLISNQAFEFSATAKFSEYAQYFDGKLGVMWEKMPETMLEKCAEAKMLRKGFPEDLGDLYVHEEMEQADNIEPIVLHEAEMPAIKQTTKETTATKAAKGESSAPPAKTEPPKTASKPEPSPEELGYSSAVELEKLRMDFYKVARTTMNDKEARQYIMKLGYDNTKVIPKEKFTEITKNLENAIALPKEQEDLQ